MLIRVEENPVLNRTLNFANLFMRIIANVFIRASNVFIAAPYKFYTTVSATFTYRYISFVKLYFNNLVIGKGNCTKRTVILFGYFRNEQEKRTRERQF